MVFPGRGNVAQGIMKLVEQLDFLSGLRHPIRVCVCVPLRPSPD